MVNATIEEVTARMQALSPAQQQDVLNFVRSRGNKPQTTTPSGVPGASWVQFAGSILPEDIAFMEQAIEEGCEKGDADRR